MAVAGQVIDLQADQGALDHVRGGDLSLIVVRSQADGVQHRGPGGAARLQRRDYGKPASMAGELHFGWVLGGRAIQDVWKVPASGHPAATVRPFYGTTLRFYDPSIAAWRSTWIDPLNGRVRRFIGRPDGADIVLDGIDDDPPERWCFRDISQNAFRWTGEVSDDSGRTWRLDEQMFIRRRA